MRLVRLYIFVFSCCLVFSCIAEDIYVVHESRSIPIALKNELVFRTIQEAINAARSNDTIYLLEGEYLESLLIKNKSNLVITVFEQDEVTINGSRRIQINAGVSNSDRVALPGSTLLVGRKRYPFVYDQDDIPLWIYNSRTSMKQEYLSIRNTPSCMLENESLFFINIDDNQDYFFSKQNHIVSILNCQNLLIDGKGKLTIKNGSRRNVLISGMKVPENTFVELKNCIIINGKIGISVANSSQSVFIKGNKVISKANQKLTWSEIKNCHLYNPGVPCIAYFQTIGILVSGESQKAEISRNDVSGYFNGIAVLSKNVIVANNIIHDIKDDGIELEGNAEDVQVLNNEIYDCYRSISLAPVKIGPIYIVDNFIIQSKKEFPLKINERGRIQFSESRPFKFWSQPMKGKIVKSKSVYIINNTIYSQTKSPLIGGDRKEMSPYDSYFLNNIFISPDKNIDFEKLDSSVEIKGNLFIQESSYSQIKEDNGNFTLGCEKFKSINSEDLNLSKKTKLFLEKEGENREKKPSFHLPNGINLGKYPGKINY